MEEPRRYRTRRVAKAESDPLGDSTSSLSSSARSSTRSTASSSSTTTRAKTSTTSGTGKRGRPKKTVSVDETATTTSKPKSSMKRTASATLTKKVVSFTESDLRDKENYCPSEDELVCVTSKKPKTATVASSATSSASSAMRRQAVTKRKQPLGEASDPETANKAPAKATTARGIPRRKTPAAKATTLETTTKAKRGPASKSMMEPARRPVETLDDDPHGLPEAPHHFLQTPAKRPPLPSALEGSTIKVNLAARGVPPSSSLLQTPAKRPLFSIPQSEEKEEESAPVFKSSLLQTPAKRPPPSVSHMEEKVNATPFRSSYLQTPAKRPPPPSPHEEAEAKGEKLQRSRENSPPKRVKSGETTPENSPAKVAEATPAVMASAAKRPPPGSAFIQTKSTPFKQAPPPASVKKPSFGSGLATPARRPPTGSLFSASKLQNETGKKTSSLAPPKTIQQPPRRMVGLDIAPFPKTCVKPAKDEQPQQQKMSFLYTPIRKPNMNLQRIPEKEEEQQKPVAAPKSVMKTPGRLEEGKIISTTPSPSPSPDKREVRIYTPVPVSPKSDDVADQFSDMSFSNIMPIPTPRFKAETKIAAPPKFTSVNSAPTTPEAKPQRSFAPKTAPPKALSMGEQPKFVAPKAATPAPPPKTETPQVETPVAIYEDIDAEFEIVDENELSVTKPPSFELFSDELDGDGDIAMNDDDSDDFTPVELQSPTPTSRRQSGIFAPVSPKTSPAKASPLKDAAVSYGPITPPTASRKSDLMFFSSPANVLIDDDTSDEEMDENRAPTLQFFNQQFAIDPRLTENTSARNIPGSTMKIALKPPADDSPIRRTASADFGPITPRAMPSGRNTPAGTPSKTPKSSRKSITGPLSGATVYVDARTIDGYDASSSFAQSLANLGAKCVKQWTWNPSKRGGFGAPDLDEVGITHVVFKDGSPRTLQKVKETQGLVFCVGVTWAMECEKQQRWVEEDSFLYDLDFVPRGGQRRRKSMEPKALASSNNVIKTPGKENSNPQTPARKEVTADDFSFFSKPLAPMPPSTPLPTKIGMALNLPQAPKTCPPKNMNHYFEVETNPYLAKNLLTARRKSLQFKPKVSSPLSKGCVWAL